MKKLSTAMFLFAITGCAATPEELAAVEQCRKEGNTPYTYSRGALKYCIPPEEQERLERLELACVTAGGSVDYDIWGKYRNCKGTPAVKVNVNNNSSTFKPYCPPSKYPIYGCQ